MPFLPIRFTGAKYGFYPFRMIAGKKVILGITGGIAAYKAAFLIRMFKKAGAEVKVVGTANAFEFITRVTLESLSENRVYDQVFGEQNDYTTEHVALTDWGDVFVVAPATANIIGKYANGIADDALSTSLLAFDQQVFMAPAMNCKMFAHAAVQDNIRKLKQRHVQIIEPAEGFLACGYEGWGRMEEPETIFEKVRAHFAPDDSILSGKKVLVSAGPTQEAIDPVRFIGNHSSGKMGYALAAELIKRGAEVTLVSGPTALEPPAVSSMVKVTSAVEMHEACMAAYPECDVAIMAAAVADYAPEKPESRKIKKKDKPRELTIRLKPTPDILGQMGKEKKQQVLVGFALETNEGQDHATIKLKQKNLDFVVLNTLADEGAGFTHDTNKISIIDNKFDVSRYPLKGKDDVAKDIVNRLEKHLSL